MRLRQRDPIHPASPSPSPSPSPPFPDGRTREAALQRERGEGSGPIHPCRHRRRRLRLRHRRLHFPVASLPPLQSGGEFRRMMRKNIFGLTRARAHSQAAARNVELLEQGCLLPCPPEWRHLPPFSTERERTNKTARLKFCPSNSSFLIAECHAPYLLSEGVWKGIRISRLSER